MSSPIPGLICRDHRDHRVLRVHRLALVHHSFQAFLNLVYVRRVDSIHPMLGLALGSSVVHCNNATAIGIVTNTIKRQRSRAMEMRYFWTREKDAQKVYSFEWHPGMENLADYQSKHHPGAHHTAVRPYYLHETNSPLELPCAIRPSTLKGCVGTIIDGYKRNVPLPRVPQI